MSGFREWLAARIAPGMAARLDAVERRMEETAARQGRVPATGHDPDGEGYRRLSSFADPDRRDMTPVSQATMLELAYYMYDTSGLTRRFVRDTKNFVLGGGVQIVVENDPDGSAWQVLEDFRKDPYNNLDTVLHSRLEFLSLLGEQCWPVDTSPVNGRVRLGYVDPVNIADVHTVRGYPEVCAAVELTGRGGRKGPILAAVREESDPRKESHGRLTGEVFYWAINRPPNSPRGRSDLVANLDFIHAFEESMFQELDRLGLMKAFIWDVTLQGADEEQIREFLRENRTPKPGSTRAHNERVSWQAVSPDLAMADTKNFFDMMRTYLAACQHRPDSWFGSGGKAYQTEADLMGEPTFRDLESRQAYVAHMLRTVFRFVLDQAVIHKAIPPGDYEAEANLPEIARSLRKEDAETFSALFDTLAAAEDRGWITRRRAATLFADMAHNIGMTWDAADELAETVMADGERIPRDYEGMEALMREIEARIEARRVEREVPA